MTEGAASSFGLGKAGVMVPDSLNREECDDPGPSTSPATDAAPSDRDVSRRRRRHVIAMIVLGAVTFGLIGVGINKYVVDEIQYRRDVGLRANPPQRQLRQAQELLVELNSHDPAQVSVPAERGDGPEDARVRRNILAAMPRAGCHYTLDSVRDDGVHRDVQIGTRTFGHVYRYDILVHEQCAQSWSAPMTIGVLSTPGMGGYWSPVALTVEQ